MIKYFLENEVMLLLTDKAEINIKKNNKLWYQNAVIYVTGYLFVLGQVYLP